MNEDVFAAQTKNEIPVSHEEIKDLQAKIYKLFLQVAPQFGVIINAFCIRNVLLMYFQNIRHLGMV